MKANVYLYLLDRTLLPIGYEAVWFLEAVWTLEKEKKCLPRWDSKTG
jgi:hypothetical protein